MKVKNPDELIASLFRIVEDSDIKVYIDGVNVKDLGLFQIRSKISLLPRCPLTVGLTGESLFDPFDDLEKEELIEILNISGVEGEVKGEDFKP